MNNNTPVPMESFFTREKANAGVKMDLYTPDGHKTDHWLRLRGVDSDEFRLADVRAKRETVRLAAIADLDAREEALQDLITRLTATLVMSWSFDKECTLENVIEFLQEAPQIAHAVDMKAGDRGHFFRVELPSSADTQGTNSSSTKSRKAPSKASAPA